jgi:murein DD-endopeptidase MepM/ murein hydrolase activator NlpD
MAEAILSGIEGLVKLPVLKVGGVVVGAGETVEQLRELVEGVIGAYAAPDTIKVQLRQSVAIAEEYVREDIQKNPDVLRALLDPANLNSPFSLTVETIRQVSYTEAVPCQTFYIKDPTMYEGEEAVLVEGIDGVRRITENALYVNGEIEAKWVAGTEVLSEPVDGLVAVGTAKRPPTASTGTYIWPAQGRISSYFGRRTGFGSSNHQGIDIANRRGTDIVAADGGLVIKAGWDNSGYGRLIIIEHDNGDLTYYAHCNAIYVNVGERVKQGQVIAAMGATGMASGSHCHFEIRVDNKPVNPIHLLPEKESM